jgi:UDP-glucuronate 4-epimerase
MPFSVHENVDHPLALYGATKKANELMAHSYSHLYDLPTTGLRFFTVYGPWGRPDMSPVKFARSIGTGKPIDVYNYGRHSRDFTYIDDIVEGVVRTLDHTARANADWDPLHPDPASSSAPFRVYNIGNQQPVDLLYFIELIEKNLGRTAEKNLLPMQPGDVQDTWADTSDLSRDVGYAPHTPIEVGVKKFVDWFLNYYADELQASA